MQWTFLFFAGLLEVAWAFSMKKSEGFTNLGPSVMTILLMIASFWLLTMALKDLPMSTAYAVWTGIGVVGTALIGFTILREPVSFAKLMCIGLIAIGIIGLKVLTPSS